MTVLKRLILSLPVLLFSCGDTLASRDVFLGSGIRRSLSMSLQRMCTASHARRFSLAAFGFGASGKNNQLDMLGAKDLREGGGGYPNPLVVENIRDSLERCEEALTEVCRMFDEIKDLAEALKQESDREPVESPPLLPLQTNGAAKNALVIRKQKPERKLAVVASSDEREAGGAEDVSSGDAPNSTHPSHEEVKPVDPKDIQRLTRIYGLLPEYRAKTITDILRGTCSNKEIPAWKAIEDAIKKIEKEAFARGDKTPMDLDYFKELYSRAQKAFPKGFLDKKNMYRISSKEIQRLNQIYVLLPEYRAKTITDILGGACANKELPAWGAVMAAIKKIEKGSLASGEKISMDLTYFRKLHYTSLRVRGVGGSRRSN